MVHRGGFLQTKVELSCFFSFQEETSILPNRPCSFILFLTILSKILTFKMLWLVQSEIEVVGLCDFFEQCVVCTWGECVGMSVPGNA